MEDKTETGTASGEIFGGTRQTDRLFEMHASNATVIGVWCLAACIGQLLSNILTNLNLQMGNLSFLKIFDPEA